MREQKLISEKNMQILPIINPSQTPLEIKPAPTSAIGFGNPEDSPMQSSKPAKVSKVLMVGNLPTMKENYSGLIMRVFNLFCHYGNVSAIKIFYKNRNFAAIEFQNSHQATIAMQNLDRIEFYGN